MSECRIQLRRDTVNTAWGFRLQGGHEYGSPLFVQRVFSGSPADGRLQRGDVFVSINNHDVSRMEQSQAENIIKAAGSVLALVVKRTGVGTQHQDSLLTFANEPQSQPASRGFDSSALQPLSPAAATTAHREPSYEVSALRDGPRAPPAQLRKANVVMWTPVGGDSSVNTGYDQPPHRQQPTGNVSSSGSVPAAQQFSSDADYSSYGGQDRGPPWQARDVGGGTWTQSHQGAPATSPSQHRHHHQQQQQRGRTQAHREYVNHGHPAKAPHGVSEETRVVAAEVIKMNQQEDDDTYEPKSVREIKAMFNKPSKPPVPGQQQRTPNRPRMMHDVTAPPPTLSPTTPSWSSSPHDSYPQFPSQTKSFSPPSQPVDERPSFLQQHADLIASYPPPRQKPPPAAEPTGLIKPTGSSAPKPGAGYSYQGIVTISPPKPVHKQGSGGGGGSAAGKKKEFDPSQSLVFQMLQEETERAKRGDVNEPEEEEPKFRRQPAQREQRQQQQQQPPPQFRRPQQQQGSRLQELLERDRAASQQDEDEHLQYANVKPQPPQPRQPATHHQQRMQQSRSAGGSYHAATMHHQEPTYMQASPSRGHYQQPTNVSYEEYYQRGSPARGYHHNAPPTTGYYSSYGQEQIQISDF